MGHYREKISTSFTRLTYGLGRKRRPTISRCPESQTSLIFQLPDELILYILTYVSSNPELTGPYARFRLAYCVEVSGCCSQRVGFLRPLSMTCRAMRFRFVPWVWERLELPGWTSPQKMLAKNLSVVVDAFHADMFLATCVKFMKVHFLPYDPSTLLSFVKCLESLPNLHTIEIGRVDSGVATSLERTLERLELPQIKTLIIPPAAYPLLRCCHDVEDVVCMVGQKPVFYKEFFGSLASNRNSKVKRLAIPLVWCLNPSWIVSACPRLTELTVSPYPYDAKITKTGILHDLSWALSTMSGLVFACQALPDFDTFQILYFPSPPPYPICLCKRERCGSRMPHVEQWEQSLREQAKGMKDFTIDRLKRPKTGCQEGERRERTTVRVVRLSSDCRPNCVEVEEHEVWGFDGRLRNAYDGSV